MLASCIQMFSLSALGSNARRCTSSRKHHCATFVIFCFLNSAIRTLAFSERSSFVRLPRSDILQIRLRGGGRPNNTTHSRIIPSTNSTLLHNPANMSNSKKRPRIDQLNETTRQQTLDPAISATIPSAKKDPNGETYFEVTPRVRQWHVIAVHSQTNAPAAPEIFATRSHSQHPPTPAPSLPPSAPSPRSWNHSPHSAPSAASPSASSAARPTSPSASSPRQGFAPASRRVLRGKA